MGDVVSEAAGEGYDVVYFAVHAFTLGDKLEVLALNDAGSRAGRGMVYFKRHYKDGTTRPSRLPSMNCVAQYIEG